MASKKWTKETIQELLLKNDRAVERGVVVVYRNQTADEQSQQVTSHRNGMGFTGADAEIMSSFAQRILAGRPLTEKQLVLARKRVLKYWRQMQRAISDPQPEAVAA